jgi:hypothetical protein
MLNMNIYNVTDMGDATSTDLLKKDLLQSLKRHDS